MKHDEFDDATFQSLAKMIDVAGDHRRLWEPADMAAILEHQLASPLEVDLGTVDSGLPVRLASLALSGPPLRTFRDLFQHPNPPVELLDLAKRFAKRCRTEVNGCLPAEIATVLYFLAIGVAWTQADRRISGLDDESLRRGMEWSLEQPWLDDSTRQLFQDGLRALA